MQITIEDVGPKVRGFVVLSAPLPRQANTKL